MDWISVKKELPKITDEKSFVTVKVRTKYNGIGEMTFGYSGAMGEPMTGSFWHPIRNFSGEVHLDNDIIDWMPLDELPREGNPKTLKNGNCNLVDVINRRELLIAFATELQNIGFNEMDSIEKVVDIWLKSN